MILVTTQDRQPFQLSKPGKGSISASPAGCIDFLIYNSGYWVPSFVFQKELKQKYQV